ncbi:MAG TPA: HD domain-containing phosphohydrolase [Candidatus Dormibacteraeota bacterium]|jgi:putative nucleotidyltransferase with HDIG domain|nr:HD domain-containing phosphohydrolase [Candidatus Dormibacteraeota bacterium]
MPVFRHRLALKIVLPFAALTLAIGAVGTVMATGELSSRSQEAFDSQLAHDGSIAQSMVQAAGVQRRDIVTLLTNGPALSQSWAKPALLQSSLERALTIQPNAIVEAVDNSGREIVGLVGHDTLPATVTQARDLSGWPRLSYLLSGAATTSDLIVPAPNAAIFSAQTVYAANGTLLGAILVGEPLDNGAAAIKAALHDDITYYDINGQVLGSSLSIPSSIWPSLALDGATRNRVTPTSVVELARGVNGPSMELISPWIESASFGYIGTTASSAGLLADTNQLRFVLAALFLAGVLLTLALGIWLGRLITRPVHRLVDATRLVSAGDLDHQALVTTRDEIGELTESFNQMTRSLKEKGASLKVAMLQLQDTYLMTIEALAAAVEARDPYTHGHTRRVEEYAAIMAKAIGCPDEEVSALHRASVLHDIGKIGIEDMILRKQGRLEPDEEIRMQRHPVIGVDMLQGIDFLEPVLPLVRHHHERWDGNGYPDQLREDEIPLGARILAVADALDAMTSDRSYRPARTFEYAKTEILKGSGSHFDPEVVTAFIKSQRAIEDLLRKSSLDDVHHPDAGDLGGWRLHVVGR